MSSYRSVTDQGRQQLRLERSLEHPVERVWRALVDPQQLGQWYPFRVVELEPRVGGRISFDDGEGTIYHGEVLQLEPVRVFSFTEADDLIHIELQREGENCRFIFTHEFDDPSIAENNEIGWNECFRELTTLLRA